MCLHTHVSFYACIDDILVFRTSPSRVNDIKSCMSNSFEMKSLGEDNLILGMI